MSVELERIAFFIKGFKQAVKQKEIQKKIERENPKPVFNIKKYEK